MRIQEIQDYAEQYMELELGGINSSISSGAPNFIPKSPGKMKGVQKK